MAFKSKGQRRRRIYQGRLKGETREVGKRPRKCDTVKASCQKISKMGNEKCQLDLTTWKTLGT